MKTLHEALALSGLLVIVLHDVLLLPDPFLRAGLAGITIPFALAGQPAWTAIGVVAGWVVAIITLSFYVRRLIGVAAWRWLHRWTLAVYALGLGAHARVRDRTGAGSLVAILAITAAPVRFAGVPRALAAPRVACPLRVHT